MNQKPQPNTGLKVGDRVRLIAETLAWKAEMTLQGQIERAAGTEKKAKGK